MNSKLLRLAVAVLVLAPGAAPAQLSCATPQKPMLEVEMMFGRNIGGKPGVSEAQWRAFLAREVTPRFPDGLTVYDARGQWRNPQTKAISRERTKVVMIAMPPDAGNEARLQEIIEAYKTRFKQQSVGLIIRPSCVSF
jgi:hypothetical protein